MGEGVTLEALRGDIKHSRRGISYKKEVKAIIQQKSKENETK